MHRQVLLVATKTVRALQVKLACCPKDQVLQPKIFDRLLQVDLTDFGQIGLASQRGRNFREDRCIRGIERQRLDSIPVDHQLGLQHTLNP